MRLKSIPFINVEAKHWSELINMNDNTINEPPLVEDFPTQLLQTALINGEMLELPDLPAHSQGVERAVKLVSQASHTVYGLESRHKHILAKTLSREMRPSFISKGYYKESYDNMDI